MSRINIGIDTGGTYTDAVVVDMESREVLASAKAHTSYGDLSIGVSAALKQVLETLGERFHHGEVSLVSVSTTLATNALVEGQGAPVAALLIGFDDAMAGRTRIAEAAPAVEIFRIDGGHQYNGEEASALDEAAIRKAVEKLRGKVRAYAVSSVYSVRNPQHEHRCANIIRDMCADPVTLSSDLTPELDGPRRALTATLNARIVSRIVALVAAVRRSLAAENIDARLMIVRGDGSLADADVVAERPIETILSGPAASVIGARYLTRLEDFIISDIGGTTTDIATAHDGWPDVNAHGSMVGEYRTLVHAIDMQTHGLGGDSEVITDYSGNVSISNVRVVPVSMLGARWPSICRYLRAVIRAGKGYRTACRFVLHPEGAGVAPGDLAADEKALLDHIGDEPQPWSQVIARKSDEERLSRLMQKGLLQVAGFTPSDAAHSLGLQENWDSETAELACEITGAHCGCISANLETRPAEIEAFARRVVDAVIHKSGHLLLERLAERTFRPDDPLIAAVAGGSPNIGNLQVELKPAVPVIAVGGPARLYYPEAGRRLQAETVIPEHFEVANAIGAAVGMIRTHAIIEVTAREEGGYLVHGEHAPEIAASSVDAIKLAEALARNQAESRAASMGASTTETVIDVQRVVLPDTDPELGLVAATVTAETTGQT